MARPKKYLTEEDRIEAIRADKARWRERNRKIENKKAAKRLRDKRAARAIAEGRILGQSGNWRRFSKEEIREKRRLYVDQNRELIRQHVRLRYARRKAMSYGASGKHSVADIEFLWKLQKGKCAFCLQSLIKFRFHIDHYVPLVKGGTNDRKNLRLLHKKCNLSKGARDPAEHALRNGLLCW